MQEKRLYPRRPLELSLTVLVPQSSPFTARSQDLSLGGMFVVTNETLAFATQIEIEIDLPELGPTKLPAIVRWTKKGEGFGVQFGLLGARQTHALSKLVAQAGLKPRAAEARPYFLGEGASVSISRKFRPRNSPC